MLGKFSPNEGEKIIAVKISFSPFGKIFFVVIHTVVPHFGPRVEQDLLIRAAGFCRFENGDDFGVFKAQNLVVIAVGQFVQKRSMKPSCHGLGLKS